MVVLPVEDGNCPLEAVVEVVSVEGVGLALTTKLDELSPPLTLPLLELLPNGTLRVD